MQILSSLGVFLVLAVAQYVQGEEGQCHPIVQPFCKHLQYAGEVNSTTVGMLEQHRMSIFQLMHPVLRSNCSPYLIKFLCATEVPLCSQTHVAAMGIPEVIQSPRPCRDMCIDVYKSCARMLRVRARPWPRKILCDQFSQRNCLTKDEETFDFISRPLNDFFDENLFKTDLQENGAKFDGGPDAEPMEFVLDNEASDPDSNEQSKLFGLEFKTTAADGSIVALHTSEDRGVIVVALRAGKLVYIANCGEKEIIFKQSDTRYDDGEWHEISVQLGWSMLNDASRNMQFDKTTDLTSCQEVFNKATVGAAQLTPSQSGILGSIVSSFTGCIRNVRQGDSVPEMTPTSLNNPDGTMRQWNRCQG